MYNQNPTIEKAQFFWQCACLGERSVQSMMTSTCKICKHKRKGAPKSTVHAVRRRYKYGILTNYICKGMKIRRRTGAIFIVQDDKKGGVRSIESVSGMPVSGDRGSMYSHDMSAAEILPDYWVQVNLTKKQVKFRQRLKAQGY